MKAMLRPIYGGPEVLKLSTVEIPNPKDDEVLVKLKTTCVNRTDCGALRGEPYIFRLFIGVFNPIQIIGSQYSGIIEKVGKNVKNFEKGDKVFGFYDEGLSSYAEYTVIKQDGPIVKIPENISFDEAAAATEGFHNAYNFIKIAGIQKGQKIMLNGSTGAIGSCAIQILKSMDCDVTVTCNTQNFDLIKSFKPDKMIDYLKEDFTKQESNQFDFIFDAVGKSSFSDSKHLLKSGGSYFSTEFGWMGENVTYSLFTPLFGDKKVIFPLATDVIGTLPICQKFLAEGIFKPVIDEHTFTLETLAEAFKYVEKGEKTGNVIVKIE
eukprot:gene1457-12076_t